MQIARELAGLLARRRRSAAPRDGQEDQGRDGRPARGVHRGRHQRVRSRTSSAPSIFEQVAKFASYGFPKAHATAYALLAYQTAYLKANHPLEFFAAAMTMDRANQDKLDLYRQEIAKSGIRPPAAGRQPWRRQLHGRGRPGRRRDPLRARRDPRRRRAGGRGAGRRSATARGPFADMFDLDRPRRRQGAQPPAARGADPGGGAGCRCMATVAVSWRRGAGAALRRAHAAQAASDQASLFGGLLEQAPLPKPRAAGGRRPAGARAPAAGVRGARLLPLGASARRLPGEPRAARRHAFGSTRRRAAASGSSSPGSCSASRSAATAARALPSCSCPIPSGSYEVTRVRRAAGPGARAARDGRAAPDRGRGPDRRRRAPGARLIAGSHRRGARQRWGARRRRHRGPAERCGGRRRAGGSARPHGDGGARVRLVLPLGQDQEVAIDLGDDHRLARPRRMDLERRAGVLGVIDL